MTIVKTASHKTGSVAKPSILIFAGSNRAGSVNKKLARQTSSVAEQLGIDARLIDLKDYPMPLYDGDLEQEHGVPASAEAFAELIKEHDGVIIASPEYNGAFTPLLKNTIDWATRIDKGVLAGKMIGLMSATPGRGGGKRGLKLLHDWLANMRLSIIPEPFSLPQALQAFGEDGTLAPEHQAGLEAFVGQWLQAVSREEAVAA
ncbi:MAG: NAD(P)H-dependent oxidoreductase [Trueperaceae bacterium]|nr:MAG: NAD(P)H-dependent oxidoreductase [Trueperaceae bacterium]